MFGASPRRQSISSWAAAVVPGSPLPPTPRRASFIVPLESPKESGRPSLTSIGYAAAFIHLPNLPQAPAVVEARVASRARSLTTNNVPPQLSVPSIPPPPVPTTKNIMSNLFKKVTKSAEASSKAKKPTPSGSSSRKVTPGPLTHDILLRQFECGKSFNANASAVMQKRARKTKQTGVDTIYREANGAVYLDEAEKWEYENLRAGADFAPERRGSSGTLSDIDSPICPDPIIPACFDAVPAHRRSSLPIIHPMPTAKLDLSNSPLSTMTIAPPPPGKGVRRRPEPLRLDTSGRSRHEEPVFSDPFAPSNGPPKPNMF